MQKYIEKIKKDKKFLIAFALVLMVGIFLRTYGYSDLLRFGKDQARDAGIIRDIVENGEPLPLLGPKAGGTDFKMGPIFYYFQYFAAEIFGVSPDKMAYPDLLFSIATIPLLYFFLRRLFDRNMSLALTALYAVSFFAVQNGRFAWNPNSLPFFCILFLYSLAEMGNPEKKNRFAWAAALGVAIGVGVQLHTLFILVSLPVAAVFLAYFYWKKTMPLKNLAVVLLAAFILNIPQIGYEIQTGGANTKAFFVGIGQKSEENLIAEEERSYPKEKLLKALGWDIQANMMFVYPSGDDSKPQYEKLIGKLAANKDGVDGVVERAPEIIKLSLAAAFFIFGYFLVAYYIRKESDWQKKTLFKMLALYLALSLIVFIPLSHVLVLRYFLMLQFVPIILIGLIGRFLVEKRGKKAVWAVFAVVAVLFTFNSYKVFAELRDFEKGKGDSGIAIWGEEKFAGEFLLKHSAPGQKVYFVYEPQNAHKLVRSLAYFNGTVSFSTKPNSGEPLEEEGVAYFALVFNKKNDVKRLEKNFGTDSSRYKIIDSAKQGRIAIYRLELLKK